MTHYILITTKDRLKFLNNCLESIKRTTPESRIFIVSDGSNSDTIEYITNSDNIEGYVINKTNIGIAPSIEIGLHLINNYHRFRYNEGLEKDQDPWISYVQDDVEFIQNEWDKKLWGAYLQCYNAPPIGFTGIGFVTGHVAPEHSNSIRQTFDIGYEFRDHIRATHMMAPLSFWLEQLPITVNGELDRPRGHPGNGIGSDIDWYFLRDHDKSVLKRGMTNLVVPGILKHIGADNSTWQKNILPEVI
jgi:glycosyltransferase involved in cell wall biosynthesis